MDCDLCRAIQRDRGELTCDGLDWSGICPKGYIPCLPPSQRWAWTLFEQMLPGLIRGEGGYDLTTIKAVCDMNQVSPDAQRLLLPTFLALLSVVDKARAAERERQRHSR